jgi:hypothetical protein
MKLNIQQEELIAQYHFDQYIEELRTFNEQQLPGFTEYVGRKKLDQILRAIVANAEAFGFNQRGSTWGYMCLVWQFGWDCEHDPQYPWIQGIRDEMKNADQLVQAEALNTQLRKWREATLGPQSQYWISALERLMQVPLLELPVRESHFETDTLACLKNLYAKRCEVAGDTALKHLIQRSQENARKVFHLQSAAHRALVVLIAFTWGHAFMRHPMYEWAQPDKSLVTHETPQKNAQRLADGFRYELYGELTYLREGRLIPRRAAIN